jgi:hypothetical protein
MLVVSASNGRSWSLNVPLSRLIQYISIFVSVVAVLFLSPSSAAACDFEEPPPPQEAMDSASAVFSGEVRSIEPVADDPGEQFIEVRFDVDRAWKGIESTPVTVETLQDPATCGFPFEVGETYIVYAYSQGTPLTTMLYHRTQLLERADEDLEELGEGAVIEASSETGDDNGAITVVWIVLLIMFFSLIIGVVMVLRKTRPGLSEDQENADYDAGEDDPADHRR